MNTTTITLTSLSQFRRFFNTLKTKKVSILSSNNTYYPYSITFKTKTTKQANNLLKHLHLSPLQPSLAIAA
jgi:hypothetical protein